MRTIYYFKIHTGDTYNAGTLSDITVTLYGEKGQTEAKSLRLSGSEEQFQRNQTNYVKLDFTVDVGCVSRITLKKDFQEHILNGWLCDYIMVSKQPFDTAQAQCSIFKINDWLIGPGAAGTYNVSEGYPYTVSVPASRIEQFTTGTIRIPNNTVYNKTVNSTLTVAVEHSTMKVTDISTGKDTTLPESIAQAAFSQYINQSIIDTTNIALNKTEDYSENVAFGPFDADKVYEVLWDKAIYTFDILMGEVHFTFDVPYKVSFAGLRELSDGNILKASHIKKQISKMSLFNNIGIALTRKCNASCRMCCFECNPVRTETLTEQEVYDIIEQAKEIDGISRIGFSGGESMLCPDLLFSGLAKAKEAGMRTSLTSNGFWGEDDIMCRRTLNTFRTLGLDSLTISVDHYHLEYVPLSAIINIIRNSRSTGIPLTLAVGDSLEGKRAIDILQDLGADAYTTNLILYPFMPVGRGCEIPDTAIYQLPYDPEWKCHNNNHLAILYDGSVYPCCSQAVYGSALSIGNIREQALSDIAKKYAGKCIFSTLRRRGLDWFVKIAVERFGMELPDHFHSPCQLCNRLFTDKTFLDGLSEYIDQEYRQTIYEFLGL